MNDRTHCKHGHAYTDANTYINVRGYKVCRECQRQASLRSYYRTSRHDRHKECRNGHPITDENSYVSSSGYRTCRVCRAARISRRAEKLLLEGAVSSHCKNGHERTEDNTYVSTRGHIYCRVCKRETQEYRRSHGEFSARDRDLLNVLKDYKRPAPPQGRVPACEGIDPLHADVLFFEGVGVKQIVREAKHVCAMCPVKRECLAMAVANEPHATATHGIYGGLTARERSGMKE